MEKTPFEIQSNSPVQLSNPIVQSNCPVQLSSPIVQSNCPVQLSSPIVQSSPVQSMFCTMPSWHHSFSSNGSVSCRHWASALRFVERTWQPGLQTLMMALVSTSVQKAFGTALRTHFFMWGCFTPTRLLTVRTTSCPSTRDMNKQRSESMDHESGTSNVVYSPLSTIINWWNGNEATTFYKRLADMIARKRK